MFERPPPGGLFCLVEIATHGQRSIGLAVELFAAAALALVAAGRGPAPAFVATRQHRVADIVALRQSRSGAA